MLAVVLWQWSSNKAYYNAYGANQVRAAAESIRANCKLPHKIVVITDQPELGAEAFGVDIALPLWRDFHDLRAGATMPPGTWNRLKIFAPEMIEFFGLGPDVWTINVDLDCVFLGDFTDAIRDYESYTFKGWLSRGYRAQPCIYNASFFLLKLGAHPDVWRSFDPVKSPEACRAGGYLGTEQAHMSRVLGRDQPAWTWRDGIASYRFQVKGKPLPRDSGFKIIAMHGSDKPQWSTEPWVIKHYPAYARVARPRGKGPTG